MMKTELTRQIMTEPERGQYNNKRNEAAASARSVLMINQYVWIYELFVRFVIVRVGLIWRQ